MRKLVLHLVIACGTFVVSVCLTNIWNLLSRVHMPGQRLDRPVFEPDRTVSTAEPGLLEIYRDYASAQTRHDRTFFERVEADSFILVFPDGRTLSRTEDIQLLNSFPTDTVYKHDDLNIKIYGEAAIVTGRITATQSSGYSDSWRWIDICRRRGGRWQIQSTTLID